MCPTRRPTGPHHAWTTRDGRAIWRFRGLRGAAVHLLLAPGDNVLVDAGFAEDAPAILAALPGLLGGEPLHRILLTHYHMDHAQGGEAIRRATGAPLFLSAADRLVFERKTPYHRLPGDLTPAMRQFMDNSSLWQRFIRSGDDWFPVIDGTVAAGDRFAGFTALVAPGHTHGTVALHDPAEKILISADYLVYARESMPDFFKSFIRALHLDPGQALATTHRLLALDFERLFPSHGEPVLDGARDVVRASDLYSDLRGDPAAGRPR